MDVPLRCKRWSAKYLDHMAPQVGSGLFFIVDTGREGVRGCSAHADVYTYCPDTRLLSAFVFCAF